MKQLILFMFILSSSLFASTVDRAQFTYTGVEDVKDITLNTDVTKTVYENRRVRSTCYRNVVRRQCRRVCTPNRGCRNVCRNVTVRRPYVCYINRVVAVEVFDYENISNTKFYFQDDIGVSELRETFKLTQRGNNLSVDVKGSGNYLVKLRKTSENISREGRRRYVDTDMRASFKDVSAITGVLAGGITGVKLNNGILKFNVGSGLNLDDFNMNLKLFRYRRLGSDRLLFNRAVNQLAKLNDNGFITKVSIDLNKLGVNLPRKKRIIVDIDSGVDTTGAINANDLKLKANANWVFK